MRFLVYMYYTHSCYQTSIFGKNCAYYIRIFTVFNSDKICCSYYDFYFGVTFLEHTV